MNYIRADLQKISKLPQPAYSWRKNFLKKACELKLRQNATKVFPVIEETKLLQKWGYLNNAQFPHGKAITIKWVNQFHDEFFHSGNSVIRSPVAGRHPLFFKPSV